MVSISAASALVFVTISSAVKYGVLGRPSFRPLLERRLAPLAASSAGLLTLLIAWAAGVMPSAGFSEASVLAATLCTMLSVYEYAGDEPKGGAEERRRAAAASAAPIVVILAQFSAAQLQAKSPAAVALAIVAACIVVASTAAHFVATPPARRPAYAPPAYAPPAPAWLLVTVPAGAGGVRAGEMH